MIHIKETALRAIKELAKSEREEGGIINEKGEFYRCTNLSSTPLQSFEFNLSEVGQEACAIVHTHGPSKATPSDNDIIACVDSGIPWLIVGCYGTELKWIDPSKEDISSFKFNLLNRPFVFEVMDCYHILKDYYSYLDIELPNRPKVGRFWNDLESTYNPYVDEPPEHGFFAIDEDAMLQPHDMLVMSISCKRSGCGNHVGVYLGEGRMIHHPYNSLSCVSRYGKNVGWGRWTMLVYRHKDYKRLLNYQVMGKK